MDPAENPNFEKYKKAKEEIFSESEEYSEETGAFIKKGEKDVEQKREQDTHKNDPTPVNDQKAIRRDAELFSRRHPHEEDDE